jgi:hypothetical protein
MMLLLNISAAWAAGSEEKRRNKEEFHGRVEVGFLKWITDSPNMAGVVSGDMGAGLFAGKILKVVPTKDGDKIEALYHVNGAAFHFTAHNY